MSNFIKHETELQQINFLDSRFYLNPETNEYYPSITYVLQCFPQDEGMEYFVKSAGFQADYIKKEAGRKGTQLHNMVERYLKGEQVTWESYISEDVWFMFLRFDDFWTKHKPKLIFSEQLVYSSKYKIAGMCDLLVELDGEPWILDIKTSNSLSVTYDYQLAAYARCLEEMTGRKFENRGVLWLKANTRSESKKPKVYQGEHWQIKQYDRPVNEAFGIYEHIHAIFNELNPDPRPVNKIYKDRVLLKDVVDGE